MVTARGQSQLNAVALFTGAVSAGGFLPAQTRGYSHGGKGGSWAHVGFSWVPILLCHQGGEPCSPHSIIWLLVTSSWQHEGERASPFPKFESL